MTLLYINFFLIARRLIDLFLCHAIYWYMYIYSFYCQHSNLFEFRITWLYLDNEVLVPEYQPSASGCAGRRSMSANRAFQMPHVLQDAGCHSIAYRIYLPLAARLMIDRCQNLSFWASVSRGRFWALAQWSAYVLQGNAISSCSVEAKFPFNQLSNVRHTQQFPKYVDISTWWISVASAALLTDLARSRNCFSSSLGTFILASVAALS